MRHLAQFKPGEWWVSNDGSVWKRLQGPIAQQLISSFELLQGAIEMIANPEDDVFSIQAQLVRNPPPAGKTSPTKMTEAMQKAMAPYAQQNTRPISDQEINSLARYLAKNNMFKRKPDK